VDKNSGFEEVYVTFSKSTIAFIKSLLDGNSIRYFVDNEHAAGLATGDVSGAMTVMVLKEQVDLAKELLKDIEG
jgi:hypothetical protein